jgi:hypothetical protein
MTYNENDAAKAGGGNFISEGGAYAGTFSSAKLIEAATGSKGIEFSFDCVDGKKANYLTCYFQKSDGETIKGGHTVINALMGVMGLQQITYTQGPDGYYINELCGKQVGVFLQKNLYTKNSGEDGYKFDIRLPFFANTGQTIKEKKDGSQAKTIGSLTASYKDKDDRNKDQGGFQQSPQQPQAAGFHSDPGIQDADIPFV